MTMREIGRIAAEGAESLQLPNLRIKMQPYETTILEWQ
jgi:hypothetical protein